MSTLFAIMIGIGIAIEQRLKNGSGVAAAPSFLLLEDGVSFFLLEDGTSKIQLEV